MNTTEHNKVSQSECQQTVDENDQDNRWTNKVEPEQLATADTKADVAKDKNNEEMENHDDEKEENPKTERERSRELEKAPRVKEKQDDIKLPNKEKTVTSDKLTEDFALKIAQDCELQAQTMGLRTD